MVNMKNIMICVLSAVLIVFGGLIALSSFGLMSVPLVQNGAVLGLSGLLLACFGIYLVVI